MGLKIEYSSEFKKALKRQDSHIKLTSCKLISSKEYVIDDLSVLQDGNFFNLQFTLENADDFILYTIDSTENEYPVKSIEVYFIIIGSGDNGESLAFTLSDDKSEDILLSQFGNLFNIQIPSYWKATIETSNKSIDVIDVNELESYGETYGRDLFIVDSQKIVSAASELVSKDSYFRFYRLALGDEKISTTHSQLDKFGNINKEVTVNYEYSDFSIYSIGAIKSDSESSNYYVINLDTNGGFFTIKGQATCTKTYYYGSDVIKTETEIVPIEKLNNIKLSLDQTNGNLFSDLGNYVIKYESTEDKSQHCTVKAILYQQDGTTLESNNIFLYFYSNLIVDDIDEDGYEDNHKVVFVDGYYGSYRTFTISCHDVDGTKESVDVDCENEVLSNFNITVRKNTSKSKTDVTVFDVTVQALQDNTTSAWTPSVNDDNKTPYLITLDFNNDSSDSVFDNTFKFYAIQTPLCNFQIYGTSDEGESLAGISPTDNTITLPRRTIDNRVVDLGYNVMYDSSVEESEETCKYYLIENKSEDSKFNVYSNLTNNINSYTSEIDEKAEDDNSLIIEYKHTNNILNEGYSDLTPQEFTLYEVSEGVTLESMANLDWKRRANIRKNSYTVNIKGAPAIVLITNEAYLENQSVDNETDKLSSDDYNGLDGNYGFLFKYPTTLHYKIWNNVTCTFSVGNNISSDINYTTPTTISASDYEFRLIGDNDDPSNSDLTTSLEISKNESYYGSDENKFKSQFKDLNILLTKLNFVNSTSKVIKSLNIKSSEIDNGDEIFVYYDFLPKKNYEETISDLNSCNSYYVIQFDYYKDDNLSFENSKTGETDTFDVVSFHKDLEKTDEEFSYTCADPCYEYNDSTLSKSIDEDTLDGSYILLSRDEPTYIYFKSSVYPVVNISLINSFYPPYRSYYIKSNSENPIKIYYDNTSVENIFTEFGETNELTDDMFKEIIGDKFSRIKINRKYYYYRIAKDNKVDTSIINQLAKSNVDNYLTEQVTIKEKTFVLTIDSQQTAWGVLEGEGFKEYIGRADNTLEYTKNYNIVVNSETDNADQNYSQTVLNFSFFNEYDNSLTKAAISDKDYLSIDKNYTNTINLYTNHYYNNIYQLELSLKDNSVYYPVSITDSCIKYLILIRDVLEYDKLRSKENRFDRFDTIYNDDEDKYNVYVRRNDESNYNYKNFELVSNFTNEDLYTTSCPHYSKSTSNYYQFNKDLHTSKLLRIVSGGLSPKADCLENNNYIIISDKNVDNIYFKKSSNNKTIYVTTNYPLLNPGQSLLDIFNINLSGNTKFFDTDYTYSIYIIGSTKDSNKLAELQERSKNLFCYKSKVTDNSYISKNSGTLSYSTYYYLKDTTYTAKAFLEANLWYCRIGATDNINTENELSKLDDLSLHIIIYSKSAKTDVLNLTVNEISFDEENHIYKYKIDKSGTENSFVLSFNIPRIFKEYSYNTNENGVTTIGPEFLSSRSVNPGTDYWNLDASNPDKDEYYGKSRSYYRNYGYDDILRVNIPRPVLNKTFVFHNLEDDYIVANTSGSGCIKLTGSTLQFRLESELYKFKVDDEDYKEYVLNLLEPIIDSSKENYTPISIGENLITIHNYDFLSTEKSYNVTDYKSYEKYELFPIQDSFKVYKIDDGTEAYVSMKNTKYATIDRGWVYDDRIYFGETIKNSQAEIYLSKSGIESKDYNGNIELYLSLANGHQAITDSDAIKVADTKISNKTSLSSSNTKVINTKDNTKRYLEITYTKDSDDTLDSSTAYPLVLSSEFKTWNFKNNKTVEDTFTTNFVIQAYFLPYFKYTGDLFFATKNEFEAKFYYEEDAKNLDIICNGSFIATKSNVQGKDNNKVINNLVSGNGPYINEDVKKLKLQFLKNNKEVGNAEINIAGLRLVITSEENSTEGIKNNSYGRLIVSENELIEKHKLVCSFRIYYDTKTGEQQEITNYTIMDGSVNFYSNSGKLGLSKDDNNIGKIAVELNDSVKSIRKDNVISYFNTLIRINDDNIYGGTYLPLILEIK
jgi:hypothetical protein